MGLKQDLEAINTSTRKVLADCNAAAKLTPAKNMKEIPRLIDDAAQWGAVEGEHTGYNIGYDAGKKEAYDEFWNAYQNNGVYQSCLYKFAGPSWTDKVYNPKYPLVVFQNALRMYSYSGVTDTKVDIDVTSIGGNAGYMFENSSLVTIRKLKVSATNSFSGCFTGCNNLQNIVFEGEIGNNVNLSACPLTRASIESVVSVLSGAESDKTLTLKQSAVNAAFTTEEWETLVATKPNWTITLSA